MDRIEHGVAKRWTQLRDFLFHYKADGLSFAASHHEVDKLTFLLPCSPYILFGLVKKEIYETPITILIK